VGTTDIASIAGGAIERSELPDAQGQPRVQRVEGGGQPLQHRVQPGETAYSVARLYGVSVRALADWNALGPDLTVRDNQVLMIPITSGEPEQDTRVAAVEQVEPGRGTPTPLPPSASQPLPPPEPAAVAPDAPELGQFQTAASDTSSFAMPVTGSIIRSYDKGRNDGIGIAAAPGTAVRAAGSGEVAAITRDTDQVPILVLRHPDNLLTVYANVGDIKVEKGDKVSRGQQIAAIAPGDPAFLHFEIREGIESVDPLDYLK
jgi:murein DD-endopeptidase MepM/ murein hydrolase activator NlpD